MKGEVPTDIFCSKCHQPMVIKSGKNGVFLACTGYPECRNTTNFIRDDKGNIVVEKARRWERMKNLVRNAVGPWWQRSENSDLFSLAPDIRNAKIPVISNQRSPMTRTEEYVDVKCKVCAGQMVIKRGHAGQRFLACSNYPKCTHTASISTDVPCPNKGCNGTIVEKASRKGKMFYACDQYPKCRFATWDEPYNYACPECGTL